ncbi:putative membrane protein YesL [Bacillus tianshenii]|uniref:Membrane protein YesL n=1 Tax=Sutcliffiella tianshenii TaxID=1463404 RepID=A0ABS2P2P5_9BACI|nr:YesL family protein [Bacillus tianshenii]MBM7621213.1 putative membrane protein YesL [Bacillus tianshenii]
MIQTYANKLYECCEWIMKLAYLNLLWILFTLAGVVVLGIFPATVATFTVARKWVQGESDIPIFRTFFHSYKAEFWKSQILGFITLIIGVALALYIYIFSSQTAMLAVILKSVAFLLFFVYIWILVFVFPMFVHYKLDVYSYVKNTVFVTIMNPVPTLFCIFGMALFGLILGYLPGLIVVFGISAPVFWITLHTQRVFRKLEEKQLSLVAGE